jgi:hypothetical protein
MTFDTVANIFFLYHKDDVGHANALNVSLSPLSRQDIFNLNLTDCKEFHLNGNDYNSLISKINEADIVVYIISRQGLVLFNTPQLKDTMEILFNKAHSDSVKLILAVVDDVRIDLFPEFKGRSFFKTQKDQTSGVISYKEIEDAIFAIREKIVRKYNFSKSLSIGLLDLNFSDQRPFFSKHINEHKFDILNVLLTQGTKECGHFILMKSFLKSNKIKIEDEKRQIVSLNAGDFSRVYKDDTNDKDEKERKEAEKWIWYKIAEKMKFTDIDDEKPESSIANYLFDRLRREHIVIIINDIDFVKAESTKIIQRIWTNIYNHIGIEIKKINGILPYHIFLFLNDRSGNDEIYQKEDFSGSVDSTIYEKVFCIMPKIKYMSHADAKEWIDWAVGRNEELADLRPYLTPTSLLPQPNDKVTMKTAIINIFKTLSTLDNTLINFQTEYIKDFFPKY